MPIQKVITSTVAQALDGITDDELLNIIRKASDELMDTLETFDKDVMTEVKSLIIGNTVIEAVTFTD